MRPTRPKTYAFNPEDLNLPWGSGYLYGNEGSKLGLDLLDLVRRAETVEGMHEGHLPGRRSRAS